MIILSNITCFKHALMYHPLHTSDVFIRTDLREFSGSDILASFIEGEKMLRTGFMSYFVACMSHDESVHMIDGGGYRVFLSLELGVSETNVTCTSQHFNSFFIFSYSIHGTCRIMSI